VQGGPGREPRSSSEGKTESLHKFPLYDVNRRRGGEITPGNMTKAKVLEENGTPPSDVFISREAATNRGVREEESTEPSYSRELERVKKGRLGRSRPLSKSTARAAFLLRVSE